jgi:rod shape determining protein RodA
MINNSNMSNYLKKLQEIRWSVIFIMTVIASIGFMVLFSAAGGSLDPWAKKQIWRYGVGLIILVTIASTDLRLWMALSYPLYCVTLLLLVGVEMIGKTGMGAQRWIDLYIFPFQPSELMKMTLLMALARYFHLLVPREIHKLRVLVLPFLLVILPAILVLRQPDLGTAVLLMGAGFAIFFVAGIRLWLVLTAIGGVIISLPLLWHFLHDYQKQRILTFLEPERDPLGAGYHILQSKIALGSGGFWGKGFGSGSQSYLNFLPEKQTDFIFAMLCEEFGTIGGVLLIILYMLLLAYGFRVAFQSRSTYGRLLGVGLIVLFFLYVFVNMAMVMGLLPVVGVPLPLVSYGGTAMLTVMMGFGLLMSIDLHREHRISRSI